MHLKMKFFIPVMLSLALVLVSGPATASVWKIDPDHSNIMFQVKHLGLAEVKGIFRKFEGTVNLEDDIAKSSVKVTIDAASIDTGVEKRDEHLRTADFFDVAKYPTLTFVSKKVAPAGKGRLKVIGDLTMHGITKEVVLNVVGPSKELKDPKGNIRRGLAATTTINRLDFGLTYNSVLENGVLAIGNRVTIHVETELVKEK
jgi:polyisoprenoid-binding protein YceI